MPWQCLRQLPGRTALSPENYKRQGNCSAQHWAVTEEGSAAVPSGSELHDVHCLSQPSLTLARSPLVSQVQEHRATRGQASIDVLFSGARAQCH